MKNFAKNLRTAVQDIQDSNEKQESMSDQKSPRKNDPSRNRTEAAGSKEAKSEEHSNAGVRVPWLPKELQDHTYAAPPPEYYSTIEHVPEKTAGKRKKSEGIILVPLSCSVHLYHGGSTREIITMMG